MNYCPLNFARFLVPLGLALSGVTMAHERENRSILVHPDPEPTLTGAFASSWESHYYLEGRDTLDGDSILSNTLELEWESLSAGVWYGNSPDQHYDELHLSLLWNGSYAAIDYYWGYNHVRFPHGDGHHDHEVHAGLSYVGAYDIEYALDAYHSFEADGFFAEATIGRGWELTESLSMDLAAALGMNQGYVADGHDGANHVALWLGFNYALSESVTLNIHGAQNWAIDRKAGAPDDESLKDFFHAGVGLEWSF